MEIIIKKSLFEQIVKEESVKVKKLITLNEEKKNILKQLNELYAEEDEVVSVMQEDDIMNIIPDPQDKQAAIQAQAAVQIAPAPAAAPTTLEEGVGDILNKIKQAIASQVQAKDPQGFNQAVQTLSQKFGNKSYAEIYNDIKNTVKSAFGTTTPAPGVTEEGIMGKGLSKQQLAVGAEKAANLAANLLGIGGVGAFIAAGAMIVITGSGFGLPTVIAGYAAAALVGALIAGIIYVIAHWQAQR